MALTLYGGSRSRASMVRWYLERRGIPYTWALLDMAAGEQRQPAFLAINPFGKVPALVDDSFSGPDGGPLKLFESGAILLHLAGQHGGEFSGEPATAAAHQALTAQWILFANASLGPAMLQAASRPEGLTGLLTSLDPLLRPEGSLLGESWGAADCAVDAYLAYLPLFCAALDLGPWPAVRAIIDRCQADGAYRRVMGLA